VYPECRQAAGCAALRSIVADSVGSEVHRLEVDLCHKRHGCAIAPEFSNSIVSDNVTEFTDGVIKHRSALSADLANTLCLPEQIAMP